MRTTSDAALRQFPLPVVARDVGIRCINRRNNNYPTGSRCRAAFGGVRRWDAATWLCCTSSKPSRFFKDFCIPRGFCNTAKNVFVRSCIRVFVQGGHARHHVPSSGLAPSGNSGRRKTGIRSTWQRRVLAMPRHNHGLVYKRILKTFRGRSKPSAAVRIDRRNIL